MFFSVALPVLLLAQPATPPKAFEFKDGDRIVWLGNTLVEREQRYGYWETALLAANADKDITLRNLGWSGDTVFGDARAGFDDAAKGFERMVSLTLELKPTVIFVSFGSNESFEGKDGLPKFEKGLEKLLDALKPAKARVVLFTPLPFAKSKQTPDVTERNRAISAYADVLRAVAVKRGLYLADTRIYVDEDFERWEGQTSRPESAEVDPITLNGIHLTATGYHQTATDFLKSLGVIKLKNDPTWDSLEPLRKAVVAKNELFFYRWRPQNETYLFGFRKHEQGRNAKEVAEFDPLVSTAEAEIAKNLPPRR
jgi:lysophospholipase L1-like esterase